MPAMSSGLLGIGALRMEKQRFCRDPGVPGLHIVQKQVKGCTEFGENAKNTESS